MGGCKKTTIVFLVAMNLMIFLGGQAIFLEIKHRRVVAKKLFDVPRTLAREHFTKPIINTLPFFSFPFLLEE